MPLMEMPTAANNELKTKVAKYLSGSREIPGSDPVCYLNGKSCCSSCA